MHTLFLLLGGGDCPFCDLTDLEAIVPVAGWTDYVTPKPCHAGKKTHHRIPLDWPGPVIAVNDIMVHFPGRIDHAASLHPEKFAKWKKERAQKGFAGGYLLWGKTVSQKKNVKPLMDRTVKPWVGGSSGMLGATVARDGLHCERAILCGVGMTQTPHFVGSTEHPYGRKWMSAKTHWRRWQTLKGKSLEVWLRSMSGNTRDLLGVPTKEWIQGSAKKEAA